MSKFNSGMRACGVFLLWAIAGVALPAQTLTTLHSFNSTDGSNPIASLVQGTNGSLYGTTFGGGANNGGTIFKITPSGTLTTLYNFCSQANCTDGDGPDGSLVQGTDGNFYGTTYDGGANDQCHSGCGTVFKITPSGILTTLHSFDHTDGSHPYAGLIQATNGKFYGTTTGGGANFDGTVFKITPSGILTTLHSFDGADGASPNAGLIQASNGNLYGTTYVGGASNTGTVFKITPSGTLTTLHSFAFMYTDGAYPYGSLVQATDGNFYGTTTRGGVDGFDGYGTVFKITPSGRLTTLHSFDYKDGAYPVSALVQATDGNLYGTTENGGPFDTDLYGTTFEITTSGTLTTLYDFCPQTGCADGAYPEAALVQGTNGKVYGTTEAGGSSNLGTVFSLSVGLK